MANVKVAARVRPLSQRECEMGARIIVDMKGNTTCVTNLKVPENLEADSRERVRHFVFDFCYLSSRPSEPHHATQEMIFNDLGSELLTSVLDGYNACVLAYGPSGSGKTYTMMGLPDDLGLIPRMCQKLFTKMSESSGEKVTFRTDVSFLEIYNERVCDLLQPSSQKSRSNLKVREHPKLGTYVQDLTKHRVPDFNTVMSLIERGNHKRSVASTETHSRSSRSHAIFTINFTQACLDAEMPSEIVSKIHLVDLAGSERASIIFNRTRLKEGSNINKSLVTLGNVISALAEKSLSTWSLDSLGSNYSINSSTGDSVNNSPASSPRRLRQPFVPYRDSVLTWLLKDSLGGNSKTIMIATISPASTCFSETIGTLRYAQRAKSIVNKPIINEDPYVKLIRDLRAEISRLRALLAAAQMNNIINSPRDEVSIAEILNQNERKAFSLTKSWMQKWQGYKSLVQDSEMSVHKSTSSVFVDSPLPHLVVLDNHILSTGIKIYYLKQGKTVIGNESSEIADIGITGPSISPEHCELHFDGTDVVLTPLDGSVCFINDKIAYEPTCLRQADILKLGNDIAFRFNHPSQVQKLKEDTSLNQFNLVNFNSLNTLAAAHCCSYLFNVEQHHRNINLFQRQQCCLGLPVCPVMYNGSPNSVHCLIHSPLPRCCGLCVVEKQHHPITSECDSHYTNCSFSCSQNGNGCCLVDPNINYKIAEPSSGNSIYAQSNSFQRLSGEKCGDLLKNDAECASLNVSSRGLSDTAICSSSLEVKRHSSRMMSVVPKNPSTSVGDNKLFTNSSAATSHFTKSWRNENIEKNVSLWNSERCSPIGDSGSDVDDNDSQGSYSNLSEHDTVEELHNSHQGNMNVWNGSGSPKSDRLNDVDKKSSSGQGKINCVHQRGNVDGLGSKSVRFTTGRCRCKIRKCRTSQLTRGNRMSTSKKSVNSSKLANTRGIKCCKKCAQVKWEKKIRHMFIKYKNKKRSEVMNIEKLCLQKNDLSTEIIKCSKRDENFPPKENISEKCSLLSPSSDTYHSSHNIFNSELLNNVQKFVDFVKDITNGEQLVKALSKPIAKEASPVLLQSECNIDKVLLENNKGFSKTEEETLEIILPERSSNQVPFIAVENVEDQEDDSNFNPDTASGVNDSNMLLVLSAVDLELKRSLSHNDIQQALQSTNDVKEETAPSSVYVPPIKNRTNSWPEPSQLSLDQLDSEIKDLQDGIKEDLVSQVLGNIENVLDDTAESVFKENDDGKMESWTISSCQDTRGENSCNKKLVRQIAKLSSFSDLFDECECDDELSSQVDKRPRDNVTDISLDEWNCNGEMDKDVNCTSHTCSLKKQGKARLERTGKVCKSEESVTEMEEESISQQDIGAQKDNVKERIDDDVNGGCVVRPPPFILITQPSDSFSESGVVLDEMVENGSSGDESEEKCEEQSEEFPYSDDFESDEEDYMSEEQFEDDLGDDESDEDIFYIPIEDLRGLSPSQFYNDNEAELDADESRNYSQDSMPMKGLSVSTASGECQDRIPKDTPPTLSVHMQENSNADSECFVRSCSHHNEELNPSPRNLDQVGGRKETRSVLETPEMMDEDSRPLIDFSSPCDLSDDVFADCNSSSNLFSPIDMLIDYRMLSPLDRHRLYTIPELSSEYSSTPTESFLGSVSEMEGAVAEDECALKCMSVRPMKWKADVENGDDGKKEKLSESGLWCTERMNGDCESDNLSGDSLKQGGVINTPIDDGANCNASMNRGNYKGCSNESANSAFEVGNALKFSAITHCESSMVNPAIGLDAKCGLGEDIGGESCSDKKTGHSMIMQPDNLSCSTPQEKVVASPSKLGQAPAACRELWKLYKQFSEDSDEEVGNLEEASVASEQKISEDLMLADKQPPEVELKVKDSGGIECCGDVEKTKERMNPDDVCGNDNFLEFGEVENGNWSHNKSQSKINDSDRISSEFNPGDKPSWDNVNKSSNGSEKINGCSLSLDLNFDEKYSSGYCKLDDIVVYVDSDVANPDVEKAEGNVDKIQWSSEGRINESGSDCTLCLRKSELSTTEDSSSDMITNAEEKQSPLASQTNNTVEENKMKEFIDSGIFPQIPPWMLNEECGKWQIWNKDWRFTETQDSGVVEDECENCSINTPVEYLQKNNEDGLLNLVDSYNVTEIGGQTHSGSVETNQDMKIVIHCKPSVDADKNLRHRSITPDSLEDICSKSTSESQASPNFLTWQMHKTPSTSNIAFRNKSPSPLSGPRGFHLRNQEFGAFGDLWRASNDSITFVFLGPGSNTCQDVLFKKEYHTFPKNIYKGDILSNSIRHCFTNSTLPRSVSLDCISLQGMMQYSLTTRAASMESMVPEDLMGVVERGRLHEIDLEEMNGNTNCGDGSSTVSRGALKYCMHRKENHLLPSRALSQGSVVDTTLPLRKSKKSVSWSDLRGRELTEEGSVSRQQTNRPIKPIIKKAEMGNFSVTENASSVTEYTESDVEEDLNKSALFTRIQKKRNPIAWMAPSQKQTGFALKLPDHVKARIVKNCKTEVEETGKEENMVIKKDEPFEIDSVDDKKSNLNKVEQQDETPQLTKIFETFLSNQNILRELQNMDAVNHKNNNYNTNTNFINRLSVDCDWTRLATIMADASVFFQQLSSFCASRTKSENEKTFDDRNGKMFLSNDTETQTSPDWNSKGDSKFFTDFSLLQETRNHKNLKRHSLPLIFDSWTNMNDKQYFFKDNLTNENCKFNLCNEFCSRKANSTKVDSAVQVNTLDSTTQRQKEQEKKNYRKEACMQKELEILNLEKERVVKALQKFSSPNGEIKMNEDNFEDELTDDLLCSPDNRHYLLNYQSKLECASNQLVRKLGKLIKHRRKHEMSDDVRESSTDESSSLSSSQSFSSEYLPLKQDKNIDSKLFINFDGVNRFSSRRRRNRRFARRRTNSSPSLSSNSEYHLRPLDYHAQLLEIRRRVVASSRSESTSSSSSCKNPLAVKSTSKSDDTKHLQSPSHSSTLDSTTRDIKTLLWECQAARFRAQHEIELAQEQLKCQRLAVQNLASVLKQRA